MSLIATSLKCMFTRVLLPIYHAACTSRTVAVVVTFRRVCYFVLRLTTAVGVAPSTGSL